MKINRNSEADYKILSDTIRIRRERERERESGQTEAFQTGSDKKRRPFIARVKRNLRQL